MEFQATIAPFLTKLSQRVKAEDIVSSCPATIESCSHIAHSQRVGSYPKMLKGVDVSLIGFDQARLAEVAEEVAKETEGEVQKDGVSRVGEQPLQAKQ